MKALTAKLLDVESTWDDGAEIPRTVVMLDAHGETLSIALTWPDALELAGRIALDRVHYDRMANKQEVGK